MDNSAWNWAIPSVKFQVALALNTVRSILTSFYLGLLLSFSHKVSLALSDSSPSTVHLQTVSSVICPHHPRGAIPFPLSLPSISAAVSCSFSAYCGRDVPALCFLLKKWDVRSPNVIVGYTLFQTLKVVVSSWILSMLSIYNHILFSTVTIIFNYCLQSNSLHYISFLCINIWDQCLTTNPHKHSTTNQYFHTLSDVNTIPHV